jgi:hypothetical protein
MVGFRGKGSWGNKVFTMGDAQRHEANVEKRNRGSGGPVCAWRKRHVGEGLETKPGRYNCRRRAMQ